MLAATNTVMRDCLSGFTQEGHGAVMCSLQQTLSWETAFLASLKKDMALSCARCNKHCHGLIMNCRQAPRLHSGRHGAVMCSPQQTLSWETAFLPPGQEKWHHQLRKIRPQTGHCCQNTITISITPSATTLRQDRLQAVSTHHQCGQSFKSCRSFK